MCLFIGESCPDQYGGHVDVKADERGRIVFLYKMTSPPTGLAWLIQRFQSFSRIRKSALGYEPARTSYLACNEVVLLITASFNI